MNAKHDPVQDAEQAQEEPTEAERWFAWKRYREEPAHWENRSGTIDWLLAADAYFTKRHRVDEGVGGYKGKAGRARCGVSVPKGDDEDVVEWSEASHLPACRRCKRAS